MCIGIGFMVLLVAIYIGLWVHANSLKCIHLTINNTKIEIKFGDIFQEKGLKVINVNEYFDTLVDEKIIASATLHGQFIKKYVNTVEALNAFNKELQENTVLSKQKLENNVNRSGGGKTQKYKLGSVHTHKNEYVLMAFTEFDDDNRAFLTMSTYINCLLNFWVQIDPVHACRSIAIPLFGASSGMTRIIDYNDMPNQEKLELLL